MKNKLDAVLNQIQLYSYLLPTVKIGNVIMDFREKYTLSDRKKGRGGRDEDFVFFEDERFSYKKVPDGFEILDVNGRIVRCYKVFETQELE